MPKISFGVSEVEEAGNDPGRGEAGLAFRFTAAGLTSAILISIQREGYKTSNVLQTHTLALHNVYGEIRATALSILCFAFSDKFFSPTFNASS